MKRKVSVIVPVYNCEGFLTRAIESVVKQCDFNENELILVDDGSTDGSALICDEYASRYENIIVIHQKNAGVSVARNNGIDIAQGEWIFFLDSDDYLLDNAFDLMFSQGEADIICAAYDSNGSAVTSFENDLSPGVYNFADIHDEMCWLLASSNQFFYPCWSKLFRRSLIIDKNIEFPVGRKFAEDMVFVYTYLQHCKTVSLIKEKIYFYYINSLNATSVVSKSFDTMLFIFEWKRKYFNDIAYDHLSVDSWLISSFLFKSFFSIKTAATYMNGVEAIQYVAEILNNDTFYSLYVNSDEYKTFKDKTDTLLDRYIRKKKPIMIFLVLKINLLKTKLLEKIVR